MISKDQLKQALIEQREAILRRPLGVKRTILNELVEKARLPHVIVLTGLRRSGKSTLLRQLIHARYHDEDFYYLNFEDERLFNFNAKDFNVIYEAFLELFGEKKTFFIDEIQNIENFEIFVRRFYDSGFKFFITGSSASLLSREIGTRLTGRHLDLIVMPFSFKEYLSLKGFQYDKQDLPKTLVRVELKKMFSDYLVNGGMPEYTQYNEPEILTRIYEDIVIKDIMARYKVDNAKSLKELYQYLVTTASQRFSYNSLTKIVGISSANTIKKFIDYLEQTYFIAVVSKFDNSLKKQIMNDKKIYVVDNGFIPKISIKFTKDYGWMLENLVFTWLRMRGNIFYHIGKFECDFVVSDRGKIRNAVQVSWNLTDTNKEREISGLLEAMNKFGLKSGLILTNDENDEIRIKGKRIIVKPVWEWLIEP